MGDAGGTLRGRDPADFVKRWSASGGAERSNYHRFLTELCGLIAVEHPDPATDDNRQNDDVFERAITFDNGDGTSSTRFADLYKRGAFVCETKQGVEHREQEDLLSAAEKAATNRRRKCYSICGSRA